MSLSNVWLNTLADGLVRADQVIGVHTRPTPALTGKASRWLLDVVLPGSAGSGQATGWTIGPVHRTLAQTSHHPGDAPPKLTRLLARLNSTNAAGVITTITSPNPSTNGGDALVQFRFTPFAASEPGRLDDAEHL
ncbi:MAG: hypothetical protein ACT4O0_17010 [Pseudonocardia sp.]|jgi:hypothetical protein